MTWQQGRETVQALLDQAELDRVPPSQALADRYLTEAARHLAAAEAIAPLDPAGAYQLAYDCARKAAASLLATQGLRATTRGGHVAVQDTINAQFPIPAFRAFSRLRRRRAQTEYPDLDTPTVTTDDAQHGITQARDTSRPPTPSTTTPTSHPSPDPPDTRAPRPRRAYTQRAPVSA